MNLDQPWTPARYHSNGSSPRTILEDLSKAYSLLGEAGAALRQTSPHGRDDLGGDTPARRDALRSVLDALGDLREAVEREALRVSDLTPPPSAPIQL